MIQAVARERGERGHVRVTSSNQIARLLHMGEGARPGHFI